MESLSHIFCLLGAYANALERMTKLVKHQQEIIKEGVELAEKMCTRIEFLESETDCLDGHLSLFERQIILDEAAKAKELRDLLGGV